MEPNHPEINMHLVNKCNFALYTSFAPLTSPLATPVIAPSWWFVSFCPSPPLLTIDLVDKLTQTIIVYNPQVAPGGTVVWTRLVA